MKLKTCAEEEEDRRKAQKTLAAKKKKERKRKTKKKSAEEGGRGTVVSTGQSCCKRETPRAGVAGEASGQAGDDVSSEDGCDGDGVSEDPHACSTPEGLQRVSINVLSNRQRKAVIGAHAKMFVCSIGFVLSFCGTMSSRMAGVSCAPVQRYFRFADTCISLGTCRSHATQSIHD
jgi:hypothetical protein